MTPPRKPPAPGLDEVQAVRQAEFERWSADKRASLLAGSLQELEQAIAADAIAEMSDEDRIALIDAFADRCRTERTVSPSANGAMTIVPLRERYRTPVPFAEAMEPAGVEGAFPQLSLARAVATSAGYWGGIMACGAVVLFLLDW